MSSTDISADEMARYVEREVTEARAREIDEHLAGCARCRERLRQARSLAAALGDVDIPAEDDFVKRLRDRTDRIASSPPSRRRPWARVAAATAVAAAAAVVVLMVSPGDGFREKAGGIEGADGWVALKLFRVEDGATSPLGATMLSGAAVAVAYTNIAPEPYTHLAVFAVDANRAVHWYYPAHTDPTVDPESIQIGYGSNVELPEMVSHDLPHGSIALYGLFTRVAVRVSTIEALVAARPPNATNQRLDIPDSAQAIHGAMVTTP